MLAVAPPTSVSSKAAPDKSILITLTKDGKVFLMLGDDTKKSDILEDVNKTKGLNLSPAELAKWKKAEFIGQPFSKIKSSLDLARPIPANQMEGIPVDTTNNELSDWMRSVTNTYKGGKQKDLENMLLVKGDNAALYPVFKNVKLAFKKNDIFKFRIVTNSEAVPAGSELYNASRPEAQ